MKWIITADRIEANALGKGDMPSGLTQSFGAMTVEAREAATQHLMQNGLPHAFRLYDDDDNLYFEGIAAENDSEAAFEPLDWAMGRYGCTRIDYLQPNGAWETL